MTKQEAVIALRMVMLAIESRVLFNATDLCLYDLACLIGTKVSTPENVAEALDCLDWGRFKSLYERSKQHEQSQA